MEIRVKRAFYVAGLVQEVGNILNLPDPLAKEVIGSGKAEECQGTCAAAPVVQKRIKKEKANV